MMETNKPSHIRHTHAEKMNTTWCGVQLYSHDWTFQNIDHACYSIQQEGSVLPCLECVKAIITLLKDS